MVFDLKGRSSYENFRIDGEKYGITFTDGEKKHVFKNG
jgi:hypothetical protein